MKILFGIILMAVILSGEASGQTYKYIKFPTSKDKPVWLVRGHNWMGPIHFSHSIFGMFGDTLINNNKYSKFYGLSDTFASNTTAVYYICCTREDSLKKVFVIYDGETKEKLLFDFSKNKGDTIYYNHSDEYPSETPYNYRRSIDYLYIHDTSLISYNVLIKYYELRDNNSWGHTWIEGIGNENTILSPIYFPSDSRNYYLACFKKADTMRYGYGGEKCLCINLNGISPGLKSDDLITVYPNPSNSEFAFKLNSINQKIKTLQVFSPTGKILLEKENINSNSITVPTSELPKGINIYSVQDNVNRIYRGKLVVQ
jgi:hypothetical protein